MTALFFDRVEDRWRDEVPRVRIRNVMHTASVEPGPSTKEKV